MTAPWRCATGCSAQGWDDVFLDTDPLRGIAAGERWERSLNQAALRCEAVLFLVSRAWLASDWCQKEFNLAHRLNKRLFGLLIEDLPIGDLPATLTGTWQLVPLASGRDHTMLRATLPGSHDEAHVTFSKEGLTRLRIGLERAGTRSAVLCLAAGQRSEPAALSRPAAAGGRRRRHLFRARSADHRRARSHSRHERRRAAALPGAARRVGRRQIVVPARRPVATARARRPQLFHSAGRPAGAGGDQRRSRIAPRAGDRFHVPGSDHIARRYPGGDCRRRGNAAALAEHPRRTRPRRLCRRRRAGESADAGAWRSIKARNCLSPKARGERASAWSCCATFSTDDAPAMLVLVTIRSDAYEPLQTAKALESVTQQTLSLTPMPRGAYQAVIEGPAARLEAQRSGAGHRAGADASAVVRHRGRRRPRRAAALGLYARAPLSRIWRARPADVARLRRARPHQGLDRGRCRTRLSRGRQ